MDADLEPDFEPDFEPDLLAAQEIANIVIYLEQQCLEVAHARSLC